VPIKPQYFGYTLRQSGDTSRQFADGVETVHTTSLHGGGMGGLALSSLRRCRKAFASDGIDGSFGHCQTAIVFCTHFFFNFRHTRALIIEHTSPDGGEGPRIFDRELVLERLAVANYAIPLDHMKLQLRVWATQRMSIGSMLAARRPSLKTSWAETRMAKHSPTRVFCC
jgi:hypothetical protein